MGVVKEQKSCNPSRLLRPCRRENYICSSGKGRGSERIRALEAPFKRLVSPRARGVHAMRLRQGTPSPRKKLFSTHFAIPLFILRHRSILYNEKIHEVKGDQGSRRRGMRDSARRGIEREIKKKDVEMRKKNSARREKRGASRLFSSRSIALRPPPCERN